MLWYTVDATEYLGCTVWVAERLVAGGSLSSAGRLAAEPLASTAGSRCGDLMPRPPGGCSAR
jgi:hypothetical protein